MQVEHELVYKVTDKWHGATVRNILTHELCMARQVITRLKRSGCVYKNDIPCYMRDLAMQGDMLRIVLREELEQDIAPEEIPISIIYEDEHLLAVNKPAGLVVHPTKGYMSGTLANGVMNYWLKQGKYYAFRPIHRLDRDTSGLLLIAKNPYVQELVTVQHHNGEWTKKYLGFVTGALVDAAGCIEAPIARVGNGSRARIISADGKEAITLWQRLEVFNDISLVCAELVTGRTHQIRVHFAHIGHPLLGDELYGTPSPLIARQALHAAEIRLVHPVTKERLCLTCPLPNDMQSLMHCLTVLP